MPLQAETVNKGGDVDILVANCERTAVSEKIANVEKKCTKDAST
jgi:hypothetical protein